MDVPGEHELTKKAGPLPVWGWGLIIGAVIVGYMYYRNNAGGGSSSTYSTGTAPLDPNAVDNAGLYSGDNANASLANQNTQAASNGLRTNVAWLRAAVQYETGKGRNALTVQRALMKYLSGLKLTIEQEHIVNSVLTGVGLPPKPPKKVSTVSGNTPAPTHNDGGGHHHRKRGNENQTPPTKPHPRTAISQQDRTTETQPHVANASGARVVMVDAQPGDTAASVAQRAYGISSPFHIQRIVSANAIGSRDEFPAGATVKVPL